MHARGTPGGSRARRLPHRTGEGEGLPCANLDMERVLVVVVAAVAIVASAGGAAAGGPAQQNAARPEATINQLPEAWPTETIGAGGWTVYTQMGVAVQDKSSADGDCSTGGSNPSGATDIIRGDSPYHPSALWTYDPETNVFYYRIRVAGMPLTNGAQNNGTRTGGDPSTNVTWNLLIDADNDGWKEFTVVLDGDSGGKQGSDISVPPATNDGDDVKIYYNNGAGQCVTAEAVSGNQITNPYQLVWWGNAGTQNAAVPGSPTGDGATWTSDDPVRLPHRIQHHVGSRLLRGLPVPAIGVDRRLQFGQRRPPSWGSIPLSRSATVRPTATRTRCRRTTPRTSATPPAATSASPIRMSSRWAGDRARTHHRGHVPLGGDLPFEGHRPRCCGIGPQGGAPRHGHRHSRGHHRLGALRVLPRRRCGRDGGRRRLVLDPHGRCWEGWRRTPT